MTNKEIYITWKKNKYDINAVAKKTKLSKKVVTEIINKCIIKNGILIKKRIMLKNKRIEQEKKRQIEYGLDFNIEREIDGIEIIDYKKAFKLI